MRAQLIKLSGTTNLATTYFFPRQGIAVTWEPARDPSVRSLGPGEIYAEISETQVSDKLFDLAKGILEMTADLTFELRRNRDISQL